MSGMAEFSNEFHVIVIQEPKVIEEWEKIYHKSENQFSNLLSGESQQVALQNYISSQNCIQDLFIFQITKKFMEILI